MKKVCILLFILLSIVLLTAPAWAQNMSPEKHEERKKMYDESNHEGALSPLKKPLELTTCLTW
jgi:hypothetical protein